MLLTAQNLPHMLQVSLWSSSGILLARMDLAVSGSKAQAYWGFLWQYQLHELRFWRQ